ncbi:MAG: hypothetical protein EOP81_01160 [Variovorax sp.]|nr:MAG: hypothetical protein EOP81_01160 [Variovorax sp.]
MSADDRTRTRFVPPAPVPPSAEDVKKAEETKAEAMKSPEFREALRKDDERERQADYKPVTGMWGQTGAGPDVKKTDPAISQKKEESRAQREEGYSDGEA